MGLAWGGFSEPEHSELVSLVTAVAQNRVSKHEGGDGGYSQ